MTNEVGQDSTNEGTQAPAEAAAGAHTETPARTWSLVDWLWQGQKARELKRELSQRSPRTENFVLRANATLTAARNLKPEEGGEKGAIAIVASLYLDAVQWALEALSASESESSPVESSRRSIGEALRVRLAQKNLESAVLTYEKLQNLDTTALWETELSSREVEQLDQLAQATLDDAERPSRELDNIWFARLVRVVVPLVLLTAGALAGGAAIQRAQLLAETQFPWEASSKFPAEKGCESPHQECAETRFFFCTDNENRPWIRFDLGKTRSVSRVTVKNRTDCAGCAERAVPLVIEVSEDGENWKEIARQAETFEEWKAKFPPAQARWLRLRAEKRTFLHLQQVRIH